jgi:hypothetical protein
MACQCGYSILLLVRAFRKGGYSGKCMRKLKVMKMQPMMKLRDP